MNTKHRPPCIDGDICGEMAHCPPATDEITTPEALDALPVGSVVLDGMGDAWQRSDAHTDWWAPANPFYAEADAATVLEQGGTEHPATLLYRPGCPTAAIAGGDS